MARGRQVLLVGSGGREHALAVRLLESASVDAVVVCPGNAGMRSLPADLTHKRLSVDEGDPLIVAQREAVDLVVIGPEAPLCAGLGDSVRAAGIPCFGPSKAAAALEASKAFMKEFCQRHGIPTARASIVRSAGELEHALAQFPEPPVVKADGLCAGKGVVVAETHDEAKKAALAMLSGEAFGDAGTTVVLEERIIGTEASIHALCDGKRAVVLPAAQDHKRIGEGDRGPNTGGMGTYAPAPVVGAELLEQVRKEVIEPVLAGMNADGTPFVGTLFAGLMIDDSGRPHVLEFNVRFGDPETQVLTQITPGDWGELLFVAAQGSLEDAPVLVSEGHAMCVVLAARGYPDSPTKGDVITGVAEAEAIEGVRVFHAGTRWVDEQLVTAGGRVLGVTARGATLAEARDRAYQAADRIQFAGKQFRRDIGHRALRA